MANYSRYRTETLKKMLDKAEEKLYQETVKPVGNLGDGMRLSKLPSVAGDERARELRDTIKRELDRRKEQNGG